MFKNGPKRGSQKSDFFVVFQGSIPAWSLGCPWGGSQAQKYVKMEAQTWIFYDFRKLFPRDFGDTLEIFPVFHDLQIDSTRCSVYGCLCLGLGGKPTVDASQMPSRCLLDAVQMPPKCFPDASLKWFLVNDSCSMTSWIGLQRNSVWGLALGSFPSTGFRPKQYMYSCWFAS